MKYSATFEMYIHTICSSDEFNRLNIFLRSMKKMPHGGAIDITFPNCFLRHYSPTMTFQAYFPRFGQGIEHDCIFQPALDLAKRQLNQFNLPLDELFHFAMDILKDSDWWYASFCLNAPCDPGTKEFMHGVGEIIDNARIVVEHWSYNLGSLLTVFLFALSCYSNVISIIDIKKYEQLQTQSDKYGLCDVSSAQFVRDGYYINDAFYPYSLFFDTSIGSPNADMPLLIELMRKIDKCHIMMRRDNAMALCKSRAFSVSSVDSQLFRGISLNFQIWMVYVGSRLLFISIR